jgi:hypothetical protein
LGTFAREASAALLLLLGCAGGGASPRDVEAMRAELRALRSDNEQLARKVEALTGRVDVIGARVSHGAGDPVRAAPASGGSTASTAVAPVVPPDLAVVKVAPPPRARRVPPPVPTSIALSEPELDRVQALAPRGGRALADAADGELRGARAKTGLDRAHALEDFAARYPRHLAADNALVEAADAYAAAGKDDAACALAHRVEDDYPAGDAMSGAVERLAWCESRRGDAAAERRLLERVRHEFPRTPAAERAEARLAQLQ